MKMLKKLGLAFAALVLVSNVAFAGVVDASHHAALKAKAFPAAIVTIHNETYWNPAVIAASGATPYEADSFDGLTNGFTDQLFFFNPRTHDIYVTLFDVTDLSHVSVIAERIVHNGDHIHVNLNNAASADKSKRHFKVTISK